MKKVYQFTGQQVFKILLTELLNQKIISAGSYAGEITCHRNGLVELEIKSIESTNNSTATKKSISILDQLLKMLNSTKKIAKN